MELIGKNTINPGAAPEEVGGRPHCDEEQQNVPPLSLQDASCSSPFDTTPSLKEEDNKGKTNNHTKNRVVSFGTVQIQEHQLILGDNPFSDGYPISLDWKHADPKIIPVDDYEEHHSVDLEKLDIFDRQLRLQKMGYRKTDLQSQERKRKILLTEEWAFGDNKEDKPVFGLETTKRLMHRYVTT